MKAGQVLMKLDTEASEEQRNSLEKSIQLKEDQLVLKEEEKRSYLRIEHRRIGDVREQA